MTIQGSQVRKIVVACDAGMGSSVMLATQLSGTLAKYSVSVQYASVEDIPGDADVVVCQQSLVARISRSVPGKVVLGFRFFLGDPLFGRLEEAIRDGEPIGG